MSNHFGNHSSENAWKKTKKECYLDVEILIPNFENWSSKTGENVNNHKDMVDVSKEKLINLFISSQKSYQDQ